MPGRELAVGEMDKTGAPAPHQTGELRVGSLRPKRQVGRILRGLGAEDALLPGTADGQVVRQDAYGREVARQVEASEIRGSRSGGPRETEEARQRVLTLPRQHGVHQGTEEIVPDAGAGTR